MQWDAQYDCFKFDVRLPSRPSTRRGILSCISSLYDPLGLVSPVLLPAKQILQELCRLKYGWDDPIADELAKSWKRWLNNIGKLRELKIPRCIKPETFQPGKAPELHIFSDASERGYGVASYARFAIGEGRYECTLILGKSRVAPLKSISVPRLELSAAVLAVKMADLILRENLVQPSRTYLWTDSMTVLYYLSNTSTRFATFVANRITYITERFNKEHWMFVKGSENPADHASRGIACDDPKFETWLRGPKFLESTFTSNEIPNHSEPPEGCEFKGNAFLTTVDNRMRVLWTHYSSWYMLQRAIVWLTRFKSYLSVIHCVRPESFVDVGPIKLNEIECATKDIITLVQKEVFSSEIDQVIKHGRCTSLAKLCPILRDGLLVVGGRLSQPSDINWSSYKPILPGEHAVTKLIIRYYHELEGHAGLQQTLSTSRRHFWVLKGAASIKKVINDCPRCRYLNARPGEQQMARLPECRITPGTYAFESCGVDYFGPLLVNQGRSVVKRWGCLFTCMRSRAVHIELVHTLSTDSFLMAILRFISRRGCPKEIFSDNGSNFVGADAELRRQLDLSHNKINDCLLAKGIQWHFQPPGSSHRGGVWERLIRSIRRIFRSISDKCVMKDEVLMTLLTEVEGIMNNRPLVPVYDDSRDSLALTPNDLLLLRSIDSVVSDTSIDVRRYTKWWKQAWQLSNLFWKRWVNEYLPTLELRQKWFFPKRNLKVGDVVLVMNDIGNRGDWPLGRIVATHPGDDGLVRKVDVATKKGIIQRDVRKVCFLEGETDQCN